MINNVVLMGRITHDLELKSTANGVNVVSFTLAVERSFVKQGEQRQADFIDCVAWRNTAEFITKYFNKGSMIAVTGEIQTRNYEDKNGNKRKAVEVVVDEASFCGEKNNNTAPNLSVSPPASNYEEIGNDDQLPF
jgi:single-strand DNA-binding protein